jgi:hypothetical protein
MEEIFLSSSLLSRTTHVLIFCSHIKSGVLGDTHKLARILSFGANQVASYKPFLLAAARSRPALCTGKIESKRGHSSKDVIRIFPAPRPSAHARPWMPRGFGRRAARKIRNPGRRTTDQAPAASPRAHARGDPGPPHAARAPRPRGRGGALTDGAARGPRRVVVKPSPKQQPLKNEIIKPRGGNH